MPLLIKNTLTTVWCNLQTQITTKHWLKSTYLKIIVKLFRLHTYNIFIFYCVVELFLFCLTPLCYVDSGKTTYKATIPKRRVKRLQAYCCRRVAFTARAESAAADRYIPQRTVPGRAV